MKICLFCFYFCHSNKSPFVDKHLAPLFPMSPAAPSVSSIETQAAALLDEVGHDYRHFSAKLSSARSKGYKEAIASKYKIVAFPRVSLVSNPCTSFSMQDLEIDAIYDLDCSVPTSRTFAQDDCLHTEHAPLLPALHGSSLRRARYNFQQGLVNTKEVLEAQECRENPNKSALKLGGSNGRELATVPRRVSNHD